MDVKYLHQFSSFHRNIILQSKTCGCFYCLSMFKPTQITEWIDEDESGIGQTALCPFCGIDSVVADQSASITLELLSKMKKYWFY